MNRNSISVIIPCYNSEKTIEQCIASAINQTLAVDEIIVINDGSTDNTTDVVNRLISNNISSIKIHLLEQQNKGVSCARNKGIEHSSCKWIAFLDSDDYWLNNKLEKQFELLNKYTDVVLCGSRKVKDESAFYFPTFKQILLRNALAPSSAIGLKEVLIKYKFKEEQSYMEDQQLWLQIARNHKVGVINETLHKPIFSKYEFGDQGLSSHLWEMEKGELKNYKQLLDQKYISFGLYSLLVPFSIAKFVRRVLLTYCRKQTNKISPHV